MQMKSFIGFLHECETHLNFTYAKQKYRYTLCIRKTITNTATFFEKKI